MNHAHTALLCSFLLLAASAAAQVPVEVEEIVSSPSGAPEFGSSVASDGDTVVVGSPRDGASDDGAAHVYVRGANGLVLEQTLVPADLEDGDHFGSEVVIEGDTIVVSSPRKNVHAPASGTAYVFERTGTVWTEVTRLDPPTGMEADLYGWSLDIESGLIAVGVRRADELGIFDSGAAYVWRLDGGQWVLEQKISPPASGPMHYFGTDVDLDAGAEGLRLIIGAPGGQHAFVFQRSSNNNWFLISLLSMVGTGIGLGHGFAVQVDGDLAMVQGARYSAWDGTELYEGAIRVYRNVNGQWPLTQVVTPHDVLLDNGFGKEMQFDGTRLIAGTRSSGVVYAFDWDGSQFVQTASYSTPNSGEVAFFGDGLVACASPQAGGTEMEVLEFVDTPHTNFCFGNADSCSGCPCGNAVLGTTPAGCGNRNLAGALLVARGDASVAADTLRFDLSGGTRETFGVLVSGQNALPASGACPPGSGLISNTLNGLRCVGGNLVRHGTRLLSVEGTNSVPWGFPGNPQSGLLNQGGFTAGSVRHFQVIYRDENHGTCFAGQNTSNATTITILP